MHWKHGLRKVTDKLVGILPPPLVKYILKSYYYNQHLQNRIRYHIQPFRYNTPIADFTEIDLDQLHRKRQLPGIPADASIYYPMIDRLKPFAAEIQAFPQLREGDAQFWFHNGGYEDFDAVTHYSMIRLLKPKRMIEVGCGYSSRLTTLAALKNQAEGRKMECVFIEPYPSDFLRQFQLCGSLLVEKIQQVPLAEFARLESGDILFIDTSHVLKTQDDLCRIFLEIMPALAPGVFIHFHDIFTPFDYPEEWLLKIGFHYNEQYALEAILCNSRNFEIILPVHALWREHLKKLSELLPAGQTRPAAFWLRKLQPPS
jgi:hypothetical protein